MNKIGCELELTVLTAAAVHLEGFLVGVDIELDTRPRAGKGSNRAGLAPVEGTVLVTVDRVTGVVTSAVVTAVAEELRRCQVSANLLGSRPEVIDGVLLVGQDGAIGNEDVVNTDTLARVGHVQSVVKSKRGVRVGEAVQVPVGVRSQHDWSLLGRRKSSDLDVPGVGRHGVGDVADDLTREALLAIGVNDRESDRRLGVCDHREVAPIC